MAYYSVIKRNEIGSFGVTWMNPEPVLQSEIRKKKNKYHIFTHTHTHTHTYIYMESGKMMLMNQCAREEET